MLRLVALMNIRSHVLADTAITPYRKGEIRIAEAFIEGILDQSVTPLDKGFFSANLLLDISEKGHQRHWLIPAKKNLVYEVAEEFGEGDRLVKMKVSHQARKRNPSFI